MHHISHELTRELNIDKPKRGELVKVVNENNTFIGILDSIERYEVTLMHALYKGKVIHRVNTLTTEVYYATESEYHHWILSMGNIGTITKSFLRQGHLYAVKNHDSFVFITSIANGRIRAIQRIETSRLSPTVDITNWNVQYELITLQDQVRFKRTHSELGHVIKQHCDYIEHAIKKANDIIRHKAMRTQYVTEPHSIYDKEITMRPLYTETAYRNIPEKEERKVPLSKIKAFKIKRVSSYKEVKVKLLNNERKNTF